MKKKKRGPQPHPVFKAEFYKNRPKMPRITKSDPRRLLGIQFVEAYNSCDFDTIWDFIATNSVKDVIYINRWVGKEQFFNFPSYLEVRGIDNVAEYWYSRCVVAPDLVMALKDTKLYVRSDGFSTVRGAMIAHCTRLYDGVVSDSLICDPKMIGSGHNQTNDNHNVKQEKKSSENPEAEEEKDKEEEEEDDEEELHDEAQHRAMEKFVNILLHSEPVHLPPTHKKTTATTSKKRTADGKLVDKKPTNTVSSSSSSISSTNQPVTTGNSLKKLFPKDKSITLVGTITIQLNQEQKIKQIELALDAMNPNPS
jgi:hypothetical protein